MNYTAVILAAGKGVRMCSEKPKVLHQVAGKPMIMHVVNAVKQAGIERVILVVGHQREKVIGLFQGWTIEFAVQEEQLGTGHALLMARNHIAPEENILVLAGDTPLLQAATLREFMNYHQESGQVATVLSTYLSEPYGYGRIVRDSKTNLERIVEEKDATEQIRKIKEINTGIYCLQAGEALAALQGIGSSNAQGEYYLTDILEVLHRNNKAVGVFLREEGEEFLGINDRVQLARAQRLLSKRKNEDLMRSGVTIIDPATTFIDLEVEIGSDTIIYPFTIVEGPTHIGENCQIGPYTRITSSLVGKGVLVENSRIKEAEVGDQCNIGPFAYLRPGAVLERGVKIGDFVEVKKSIIGPESKIPHLSYVGDAIVGKKVNIGCGTITCNYDGQNKWESVIEDEAFIGSNTNLVAPVRVGRKATIGAGSTITRDVPENALGVERAPQKNVKDWALREKIND